METSTRGEMALELQVKLFEPRRILRKIHENSGERRVRQWRCTGNRVAFADCWKRQFEMRSFGQRERKKALLESILLIAAKNNASSNTRLVRIIGRA